MNKKKLIWSVIALIVGFLFFIGIHQYIGAAIIAIGICLADSYNDEKKQANKNIKKKEK